MEKDMVSLTIDGLPVAVAAGTSILDAAAKAGVEIPNLCYLKELGPYGACGVCLVEVKGCPKLLRACSAKVSAGMEVDTKSERVLKARKLALELLMGDHDGDCLAPCMLECPAHTDCHKYVNQIAKGDFAGAVKTIKEIFPLPSSIGRVCPHPCERACRRALVEDAISIARLKAFAGDKVRRDGMAEKEAIASPSGKKVAIVGGGPAGLTAAYHLALSGHAVTVFDQMPEMGGMLRYGIPEYRLPKAVLKEETDAIAALGVEFRNGFKLGRDETLVGLKAQFDAVLLANGAWKSMSAGCEGETLEGVFGGIDFLREIALGGHPAIGERTAIVGGGNTAMDACRSAVRLGAKEVSIIYRRTRAEMPAEKIEIAEAEEEGVKFRFLAAPAEILGKDGRVCGIKLQVMELGEPDERGRRRPVPVDGAFETMELDSLIIAVGQRNDAAGFENVAVTKKGTIAVDEHTCATSLEGVFAAGDAVNKGAGIAIGAIALANQAVKGVEAYLRGETLPPELERVLSKRHVSEEDFKDRERIARAVVQARPAEVRRCDFREVDSGLTEEQAIAEAKRCLDCACHDYAECKLIRYANQNRVDCERLRGQFHPGFTEKKLVSIERNQRKCILCNLCVRVCDEKVGKGILGLVDRGFQTVIKPEFNDGDTVEFCRTCGKCAEACPTGALKIL